MKTWTILPIALFSPGILQAQWEVQESGTKARLRGVSVVSREVAWACGNEGTVLRTLDGGRTWNLRPVPNGFHHDFRDIEATDPNTAVLLAVGEGEMSRVYRTTNGGATWTLQHANRDPKGFGDTLAFWDADRGLALGDPVDGRFSILTPDDGGRAWKPIPKAAMPPSLPGEAAFAASGTCLAVQRAGHAWFVTGGGGVARVFRSDNWGRAWTVHETPARAESATTGLFSITFANQREGVAVGGDYQQPKRLGGVVVLTEDGGRSWRLASGTQPGDFRSAVSFQPDSKPLTLITVDPAGSDRSRDRGESWQTLGERGFHALGFLQTDVGWAVGENGVISRFNGAGAW